MITLKETKKLIDKKIKETKQHIHDIESTTQDTIYSPHRTVTPISASTGNIVLAQQRYNALKQLKHSVQSIKLRDEKKDTSEPPHLNFLRNYRWGFRRKLTPSSLHFSSPTA